MPITTRLDTARLDELIRTMPRQVDNAVALTAFDVEAVAKQNAPVDTGALRNSIQALRQALNEFWVVVGVEYGRFVEFGTSRATAQPFLIPAVEQLRSRLTERIRELFR